MIPELEALVKLQEIDAKVSELVCSKEKFPQALAELETALKKAQDTVDSLVKKQNAILGEKKKEEAKISEAVAQLDKSQEILNTIKTNREYDAIHTQIENFKQIVSGGDSRLRKFDAESSEIQKAIDAAVSGLTKIKAENDPKIEEIRKSMESIDASIEQASTGRPEIVAMVPKHLLRTYEHILKRRKNGKVLSFVNNESKTCGVCYKILEAQLVNEIRKSNEVIICQNCGSIFVWQENAK
jgi:uncharacterized protein